MRSPGVPSRPRCSGRTRRRGIERGRAAAPPPGCLLAEHPAHQANVTDGPRRCRRERDRAEAQPPGFLLAEHPAHQTHVNDQIRDTRRCAIERGRAEAQPPGWLRAEHPAHQTARQQFCTDGPPGGKSRGAGPGLFDSVPFIHETKANDSALPDLREPQTAMSSAAVMPALPSRPSESLHPPYPPHLTLTQCQHPQEFTSWRPGISTTADGATPSCVGRAAASGSSIAATMRLNAPCLLL